MDRAKHSLMRVQRFLCGLTLDALAQKTGIDQAKLSRIENGWKLPSDSERYRIARALGVAENEIWPRPGQ
jgi:transcriptional regulator with XRE-family HTH domain